MEGGEALRDVVVGSHPGDEACFLCGGCTCGQHFHVEGAQIGFAVRSVHRESGERAAPVTGEMVDPGVAGLETVPWNSSWVS